MSRKMMQNRFISGVTSAALIGALIASGTLCYAKSITIEEFHSQLSIELSADVVVKETIRLNFDGSWNGIHRMIPIVERTPQGFAHRLRASVESVTDLQGAQLTYSSSRQDHSIDLKIYVPSAVDASRTVVIVYRLKNAIRFFEEHDELYWNVTGDEWPYPILKASATIDLPRELENLRINAFTGGYGSTDRNVEITLDGVMRKPDSVVAPAAEASPPPGAAHEIMVQAKGSMGIREGLTVAVAWNTGVLRHPTLWDQFLAWTADNFASAGMMLIPVGVFCGLWRHWSNYGRDPKPGPVVVMYEPPEGLSPGEMGTLIDHWPDMRDITATIVGLAVRGIIRIRQTVSKSWTTSDKYSFELLKPSSEWTGISAFEKVLLGGLFGDSTATKKPNEKEIVTAVSTDDLDHTFYKKLPEIKNALFESLISKGYYQQRPDTVFNWYMTAGFVGGFVFVLVFSTVGPVLFGSLGLPPATTIVAIVCSILTGLITMGFAYGMPSRTKKGALVWDSIRGFEEFLSRVESHRLNSLPLTPELFEKYLPYAMALGIESKWAKAFEGIYTEPTQWYVGSNPTTTFHSTSFANDLSQMSSCTGSSMSSLPRSSGGSGFSSSGGGGGGFSGGGSGGGGGHGF